MCVSPTRLLSLIHSPPPPAFQRKVGNEPNNTKNTKKRDRDDPPIEVQTHAAANPALTNLFHPSVSKVSTTAATVASQSRISSQPPNKSHQELARVAVGKGIRHGFSLASSNKQAPLPQRPLNPPVPPPPPQQLMNSQNSSRASLSVGVQEGLTALESNYMSSLGANHPGGSDSMSGSGNPNIPSYSDAYLPGSLRHNDSLVDLAMIPYLEDSNEQSDSLPFAFIDFPWQDPNSSPS